jgi:hypothetical protein
MSSLYGGHACLSLSDKLMTPKPLADFSKLSVRDFNRNALIHSDSYLSCHKHSLLMTAKFLQIREEQKTSGRDEFGLHFMAIS